MHTGLSTVLYPSINFWCFLMLSQDMTCLSSHFHSAAPHVPQHVAKLYLPMRARGRVGSILEGAFGCLHEQTSRIAACSRTRDGHPHNHTTPYTTVQNLDKPRPHFLSRPAISYYTPRQTATRAPHLQDGILCVRGNRTTRALLQMLPPGQRPGPSRAQECQPRPNSRSCEILLPSDLRRLDPAFGDHQAL